MLGQIKRLLGHGFRVFEQVGFDEQLQQATHAGINGAFLNLAPPDGLRGVAHPAIWEKASPDRARHSLRQRCS